MTNTNLVDIAKGYFSRDVVNKFSSYLGESPEKTQRAFSGAVPSIFAGLIHRAERAPGGGDVENLVAPGPGDGKLLDNFSGAIDGPAGTDSILSRGQGLLGNIFGSRAGDAVDGIAKSSGLSRAGAGKVLAIAAPLVTALIGREAKSRGLGQAGIVGMLKGQKSAVASALSGLGMGGLLGSLGSTANAGYEEVHRQVRKSVPVEPTKVWHRMGAGLPVLLLGALAALGLFLFLRGRSRPEISTRLPEAPKTSEVSITGVEVPKVEKPRIEEPHVNLPNVAPSIAPPPALEDVKPPAGATGSMFAESLVLEEFRVARSDKAAPESKAALDDLAENLKTHPTAKVKIEGYTDNTGSEEFNEKLSRDRANTVRSMLIARGVDPSRITTEGHGSSSPVASNDDDEGRAKNRRVEVSVQTP